MHNNNPNTFSEKELGKLLNQAFLESDISKSENEKITELIAAQALGVSTVANYGKQSFLKKLIRKRGWQILLLGSLVILGGTAGLALLKNHTEEPKRNNPNPPAIQEGQTTWISGNKADIKLRSKPSKRTSEISSPAVYEIPGDNSNDAQAMYNDSAINNLIIRKPEPIHFEDPPILFSKIKDSLSLNSLHGERNNSKNKKLRKRRIKAKWREHEVKY